MHFKYMYTIYITVMRYMRKLNSNFGECSSHLQSILPGGIAVLRSEFHTNVKQIQTTLQGLGVGCQNCIKYIFPNATGPFTLCRQVCFALETILRSVCGNRAVYRSAGNQFCQFRMFVTTKDIGQLI